MAPQGPFFNERREKMNEQMTLVISLYVMITAFSAGMIALFIIHVRGCGHERRSPERRRFYEYFARTKRIIAKVGEETICGEVVFEGSQAQLIMCDDGRFFPADVLSEKDIAEIEEITEKERNNE